MPRKKKIPPKNATKKITRLAERGVAQTKIASAFGISYDTWLRWKKDHDHISAALLEARAVEEDSLVGVLYEKAMDGDRTSAIFLLKARHGYIEGKQPVNANQFNVSITLPGAQNEKQYLEEVTDE